MLMIYDSDAYAVLHFPLPATDDDAPSHARGPPRALP